MYHEAGWSLFVLAEAGARPAGRVRVWRALKSLGPAILRDGVYVLPALPDVETGLAEQVREVRHAGGRAFHFRLAVSTEDGDALRALFDRSAEYAAIRETLRSLEADAELDEHRARRAVRTLGRELDALAAVDYFPGEAREAARAALVAVSSSLERRFSPGEPHTVERAIVPLNRADYRGRTWATRARIWVDRVASAWFIRTFVDPDARFLWLADASACPADAVGFDFDGATFTHVGEAVTFQVLIRTFASSDDAGLTRLGEMVRSLDVPGSTRSAEAAGFEALMAGARVRCASDDAILDALTGPLELLHAAFQERA